MLAMTPVLLAQSSQPPVTAERSPSSDLEIARITAVPGLEIELAVASLFVAVWQLRVQLIEDPHWQTPVLAAQAEQDVLCAD
jgi:hypothetical protein